MQSVANKILLILPRKGHSKAAYWDSALHINENLCCRQKRTVCFVLLLTEKQINQFALKHIKNAKHLTYEDIPLVVDMINYGRSFVNQLQLNPEDFLFGFHWPPFNSVHHLHMHILGPKQHMSFNPMFDSRFYIFREAKKLLDSLQNANVKERSNVNQV
ncbi:Histidine triad nucleotide-binding protein 3 [Schistosoma japonicum]|nr:Histidine triad nucleotide-binding protein 3 [Schistosoma japonicum]